MSLLDAGSVWDTLGCMRWSIWWRMLRIVSTVLYDSGVGTVDGEWGVRESVYLFHWVVVVRNVLGVIGRSHGEGRCSIRRVLSTC